MCYCYPTARLVKMGNFVTDYRTTIKKKFKKRTFDLNLNTFMASDAWRDSIS